MIVLGFSLMISWHWFMNSFLQVWYSDTHCSLGVDYTQVNTLFYNLVFAKRLLLRIEHFEDFFFLTMVWSGKTYTSEGSASLKKLEKSVWRPKGKQLNKFRSMIFTTMKTNYFFSLSCLPSCLQSCFQAIWSFPLYKISLVWSAYFGLFWWASRAISSSLTIFQMVELQEMGRFNRLDSGRQARYISANWPH